MFQLNGPRRWCVTWVIQKSNVDIEVHFKNLRVCRRAAEQRDDDQKFSMMVGQQPLQIEGGAGGIGGDDSI